MGKEGPQSRKEGSSWFGSRKRSLAVYGLIGLSFAYLIGERLHNGIGTVGPQGEGWFIKLNREGGEIKFQIAVRSGGRNPAVCEDESPLVFTDFLHRMYVMQYGPNGYEEYAYGGRRSSDRRNPCNPPPWFP